MNYNKEFLKALSQEKHRTTYVRIISLSKDNNPIEQIEGTVTQGSLNLDGKSSTRRSITLTMVVNESEIPKPYSWALETKCQIEIGLKNNINSTYPDIIWFKQGIFILTSFSSQISSNGAQTINLQGRDKMCLLDGSIGGVLSAGGQFDEYEQVNDDGTRSFIKYPIVQIIRDLVHQFGKEPFWNIFIKDLDFQGLELLDYKYDQPLYLWRLSGDNRYINGTFLADQPCYIYTKKEETSGETSGETFEKTTIDQIPVYDSLNFLKESKAEATTITFFPEKNSNKYKCAKISYGETVGYKETELIYPQELSAKAGESVVSVLDKIIKNVLSNYEYFYDVDGHFVFQKKRSYENDIYSPITFTPRGYQVDSYIESDITVYDFEDFELISAFSSNPNINNIKNDFTVWGERSGVEGDNLPIHMRYAIDKFPTQYTTIAVSSKELEEYNGKYGLNVQPQTSKTFVSSSIPQITDTVNYVDWREIIFQMQADYRKFNHLDNFEQKIIEANTNTNNNDSLYPTGRTGYEQYYIDIEGFWRELYDWTSYGVINEKIFRKYQLKDEPLEVQLAGETLEEILTNLQLKIDKAEESSNELLVLKFIVNEINETVKEFKKQDKYIEERYILLGDRATVFISDEDVHYFTKTPIDTIDSNSIKENTFWNKKVYESPNQLNFWIDFLEGNGELMKTVGVPNIQDRPKVETNNDVRAIDYSQVPQIIFCNGTPDIETNNTYTYFNVGNKINKMFKSSTQGLSAKEAIQNMVYQYAQSAESVSVTAIPIYYLEPNCRVHIKSEEYNIDNDYIINQLSIPLNYNGTMSFSATKTLKRIF